MRPQNPTSFASAPPRPAHLRGRAATWVSRSLGLVAIAGAMALAVPACLITSAPDFSPPKPTAPFLIPATADPDPRTVLLVDEAQTDPSTKYAFSAYVASEDAGQQVILKLYLDYGYPDNVVDPRQPFRDLYGLGGYVAAGTLTDTQRVAAIDWAPSNTEPGCHTITLVASHAFEDAITHCPVCLSDSSQITWPIFICNETKGYPCSVDFTECEAWGKRSKSCPPSTEPDAGANQCGVTP